MGSSVTASRYTVPDPANSKRPARAVTASVNAPRSWPNSSESISDGERLAQSIITNGWRARGPRAWSSRATAFFPLPVSPAMSTLESLRANRWTCSTSARITRLCATKRGGGTSGKGGRNLDAVGAAPEAFEPVEQPHLAAEDVHDEVEVVEQNPFRAVV